jgi:hypothetical protein
MENEQMLAWKAKGNDEWDPMTGHGAAYLDGVGDFHEKMREELRLRIASLPSELDMLKTGFKLGLELALEMLENLKP